MSMTATEIQARFDRSPFMSFLGLKIVSLDVEAGWIKIRLPMRAEFERQAETNQIHGGVISALIDTAGDYALIMSERRGIPTINFRTDYLAPAEAGDLVAHAIVRRKGRAISVVDVDIYDSKENLVAIGRGTYSTRPPK